MHTERSYTLFVKYTLKKCCFDVGNMKGKDHCFIVGSTSRLYYLLICSHYGDKNDLSINCCI